MKKQQIVRVGAILAVAGITGFVVQSQGGDAPSAVAATPVAEVAPIDRGALAAATPIPGIAPGSVVPLSATETEIVPAVPPAAPGLSLGAPPAGPGLSLGTPPAPAIAAPLAPAPAPLLAAPVIAGAGSPLVPADPFAPPPSLAEPAPPAAAPGIAPTPDGSPALAAADALDPAAPACTADMALIAQPGAMLDMGLLAPCQISERVIIRHGKLVVTGKTSSSGTLIASVPALSNPAEVTILFANGTEVTQSIEVPDLADFDRFAVQWMEDDAFQLQALASGATLGGEGHVSAMAPGKPSAGGNFLSIIGDDSAERPILAEVYTWPAKTPALSGKVNLSIEAAVTAATCDREILGETLQLTRGALLVRELSFEMPGCDAVGEFVVLQNPVAAEKLAAR